MKTTEEGKKVIKTNLQHQQIIKQGKEELASESLVSVVEFHRDIDEERGKLTVMYNYISTFNIRI